MKISVELSDSMLKEVCRLTGEKKKGPAVRKLVLQQLKMMERRKFVDEVISGKFSVKFEGFEEARAKDRRDGRKLAKALAG